MFCIDNTLYASNIIIIIIISYILVIYSANCSVKELLSDLQC